MNCKKINLLLSTYTDGEINEKEKMTVEEHLASCPNCRQLLKEFESIKKIFNATKKIEPPDFFETRLFAQLDTDKKPNMATSHNYWRKIIYGSIISVFIVSTIFITRIGRHNDGRISFYDYYYNDETDKQFDEELMKIYYSLLENSDKE